MTDDKFKQIKDLINSRFELSTDEDMMNFSRRAVQFHQLVLDVMTKEVMELKKLELQKSEIFSKLFKEYNENKNRKYTPKEITLYIDSNEEYYKKCYEYERSKNIANYLESTLDNIKKSSFQIKNYVELLKFRNGS